MSSLKNALIGLAVVGVISILPSVSSAQEKEGAKIKILQGSAAALQQSNPDLAKKLSEFANEEINESMGKQEGSKEKIAKDSPEWKAKHEARVKIFKDASAALQQTHPDLAKSLEEMTIAKHKTEMQKASQEKNEKEEAGEKVEPKGDK